MYKTFKYTTEHLASLYVNNVYQIYDETGLIAIYENEDNIKLSPKIPEDVTKYKYFEELKEIITHISDEI